MFPRRLLSRQQGLSAKTLYCEQIFRIYLRIICFCGDCCRRGDIYHFVPFCLHRNVLSSRRGNILSLNSLNSLHCQHRHGHHYSHLPRMHSPWIHIIQHNNFYADQTSLIIQSFLPRMHSTSTHVSEIYLSINIISFPPRIMETYLSSTQFIISSTSNAFVMEKPYIAL